MKKLCATDSGMWAVWDGAPFQGISGYEAWSRELEADEDILRHVAAGHLVPVGIDSDGAFEFELRLATALSAEEAGFVTVSSAPFLLRTGGEVLVSGIEHVGADPGDDAGRLALAPGSYAVRVHLMDSEKKPGLPDFIVLLSPAPAGFKPAVTLDTFPPPHGEDQAPDGEHAQAPHAHEAEGRAPGQGSASLPGQTPEQGQAPDGRALKAAIAAFHRDESDASVERILGAIPDSALLMGAANLPKAVGGGPVKLEEDTPVSILTVTANDGRRVLALFTDEAELERCKPGCAWLCVPALQAIEHGLSPGLEGAVIDPGGKHFALSKDLITMLLQEARGEDGPGG